MSERSEFGLRNRKGPNVPRQVRSAGHRCGFIASASVRRRDFLVPFWSLKKELARAAGESRALASFCFSWVATANRQEQSFRAVRAAYVCLVKSTHDSAKHWRTTKPARRASTGGASQTAVAVRDPPHEAAVGPCASRSPGHIRTFTAPQPKLAALRHGLLSGPAALRCSARLTARTSDAKAEREQSRSRSWNRHIAGGPAADLPNISITCASAVFRAC